eukprot:4477098-Pleurochrysis_carterae.AAC.4
MSVKASPARICAGARAARSLRAETRWTAQGRRLALPLFRVAAHATHLCNKQSRLHACSLCTSREGERGSEREGGRPEEAEINGWSNRYMNRLQRIDEQIKDRSTDRRIDEYMDVAERSMDMEKEAEIGREMENREGAEGGEEELRGS